jgi:hypothetical protein
VLVYLMTRLTMEQDAIRDYAMVEACRLDGTAATAAAAAVTAAGAAGAGASEADSDRPSHRYPYRVLSAHMSFLLSRCVGPDAKVRPNAVRRRHSHVLSSSSHPSTF